MDDIELQILKTTILGVQKEGQLTDEALHEILGDALAWDGEKVVALVSN
jgi:hypothetical protein